MKTGLQRLLARLSALGASESGRRHKAFAVVGYTGFFIGCFLLSCYFSFPYERLRGVFEQRLSTPAIGGLGGQKVQVAELSPHWITGVALSGIVIERGPDAADGEVTKLAFDELT